MENLMNENFPKVADALVQRDEALSDVQKLEAKCKRLSEELTDTVKQLINIQRDRNTLRNELHNVRAAMRQMISESELRYMI
jgi:septal ring factor EnvC (AmiA/AmiB activator)